MRSGFFEAGQQRLTRWHSDLNEGADFFDAPNGDPRPQFQGLRKTATLDAGPPAAFGNRNRATRPQNRSEADETSGRKIGLIGHEPLPSSNTERFYLLKTDSWPNSVTGILSQTEFG
jgi:hypothetical protein